MNFTEYPMRFVQIDIPRNAEAHLVIPVIQSWCVFYQLQFNHTQTRNHYSLLMPTGHMVGQHKRIGPIVWLSRRQHDQK